jgi:uncharacterized protein with NAD-binding domain and iron-sulfur cluster
MLTIFQFFATKVRVVMPLVAAWFSQHSRIHKLAHAATVRSQTDASALRMLNGSPAERLLKPITDYVEAKGGRIHLRHGCK